jgi:DNA polymerase III subunit delta
MDALAFVELKKLPDCPVFVLAGEERFLKRLALARIRQAVLGDATEDFTSSTYEGASLQLSTVRDELETLPFLAARRLIVVQDADPFITRSREGLEKYLQQPSRTGVLVLDVKSWKSNTRLAKAIPDQATVECEARKPHLLPAWCVKWAKSEYGKQLEAPAAALLVELVGAEMGVLDQELAKLATYVGDRPQITQQDVDTMVAHSRVETAWQMLDAVADGNAAKALGTLTHLLEQGDEPIAVLGAMSWQLRKLAQVARLTQERMPLGQAMAAAGLPPFKQRQVEQSLRHLGPRAFELYDWLLEADLGLKSSGGLPGHAVLERLVVKLAGGGGGRR